MRLGITTTVPVEILLAGGHTPVDLNNVFITNENSDNFIAIAHEAGFPRTLCSWIKGQYSAVLNAANVDAVIAVVTGDCSNTQAMIELLECEHLPVYRFSYPSDNKSPFAYKDLKAQFERLANYLNVPMEHVYSQLKTLEPLRAKLTELDDLTNIGQVSGRDNHTWLVSSSDFNGDVNRYERELDEFLAVARLKKPNQSAIRLGYVGVPTIINNLYDFISSKGAEVYFNEVERQFSIPSRAPELIQRYLDYTYPYDVYSRIADIKREIAARQLDGLVHYAQAFCHRQLQDVAFRKHLDIPILTLEGDAPTALDERSKIRIESFIEMLQAKRVKNGQ
ncbi:2-hydroxyacyl-CoA dehydratase [Deferribacterales bacterium RsTz2092]|nr:2-hydroxyglutaryl-CoA dehydratase [Deferribacterales bacterium]